MGRNKQTPKWKKKMVLYSLNPKRMEDAHKFVTETRRKLIELGLEVTKAPSIEYRILFWKLFWQVISLTLPFSPVPLWLVTTSLSAIKPHNFILDPLSQLSPENPNGWSTTTFPIHPPHSSIHSWPLCIVGVSIRIPKESNLWMKLNL